MSKCLSPAALLGLQAQFLEKRVLQLGLQVTHETNGAHGLAYLALWAILETFAKQLYAAHEREKLQADLLKWVDFMNGAQLVRPADIATVKYKPDTFLNASIPSQKQLTLLIAANQAPTFYLVLATDQKYRKRRNVIAHSGEDVSQAVYDEFKTQALSAISEIEKWFSKSTKKAGL